MIKGLMGFIESTFYEQYEVSQDSHEIDPTTYAAIHELKNKEIYDLFEKNRILNELVLSLENENLKFQPQLAASIKEGNDKDAECAQLRTQLTQLKSKEAECTQLRNQVRDLKVQVLDLKDAVGHAQAIPASTGAVQRDTRVDDLQLKLGQASSDLQRIGDENAGLQQKIAQLNREAGDLRDQLKQTAGGAAAAGGVFTRIPTGHSSSSLTVGECLTALKTLGVDVNASCTPSDLTAKLTSVIEDHNKVREDLLHNRASLIELKRRNDALGAALEGRDAEVHRAQDFAAADWTTDWARKEVVDSEFEVFDSNPAPDTLTDESVSCNLFFVGKLAQPSSDFLGIGIDLGASPSQFYVYFRVLTFPAPVAAGAGCEFDAGRFDSLVQFSQGCDVLCEGGFLARGSKTVYFRLPRLVADGMVWVKWSATDVTSDTTYRPAEWSKQIVAHVKQHNGQFYPESATTRHGLSQSDLQPSSRKRVQPLARNSVYNFALPFP